MDFGTERERIALALKKVAATWERRLAEGWSPSAPSSFPWAQVRLSLAALLPGMRKASTSGTQRTPGVEANVTLILAGNTPLLSWAPLCTCLLAGVRRIRVKMSRDETVWTPLFLETLTEADAELAARIELYDYPGEDERTYALLTDADAVIAYGSNKAIAALQTRTAVGVPFFGYGHAVSLALLGTDGQAPTDAEWDALAKDILIFDQQGCLSPHIAYLHQGDIAGGATRLAESLRRMQQELTIEPVRAEAIAGEIRQAQDMALFSGHQVNGEAELRWTVIASSAPLHYPEPIGHGVIYLSPVENAIQLRELLTPVDGIVSSAGVTGALAPDWEAVLKAAGASRICPVGTMQTPPLDWPNGNRDLLTELIRLQHR